MLRDFLEHTVVAERGIGSLGLQHAFQLFKLVSYLFAKRDLGEYMSTAILALKILFRIFQGKVAENKSAMMQGVDLAMEERKKYSELILQQLRKLAEVVKAVSRRGSQRDADEAGQVATDIEVFL